jgi:hypothetical protein
MPIKRRNNPAPEKSIKQGNPKPTNLTIAYTTLGWKYKEHRTPFQELGIETARVSSHLSEP